MTLHRKEISTTSLPQAPSPTPPTTDDKSSANDIPVNGTVAASTSCALCDVRFSNVAEQRSHVRSDWHGYNLKQRLKGLKTVNETEFEKLVGGMLACC